ncbi:MAG: glutathione S-transferase family protein [Pseudomonadota bacterium]|nr:glutathione S-transferase family protein [Pseudomonadota bacterium]
MHDVPETQLMILYSSAPSPFGRKVKIIAHLTGLFDQIEVVNIDGNDPQSAALNPNPLNKIPALELDSGQLIVDSKVICEHLIKQSGRLELLPEDLRVDLLSRAALADGIIEAALLIVYERRFRAESQINSDWLTRQNRKVLGGLEWFTDNLTEIIAAPTIDQVGLAVTLGYLDFRFAGEWRTRFTDLALWLNQFQQTTPGYQLTDPQAHA